MLGMVTQGTVQNGYVVPVRPLELPDGALVHIVSIVPPNPPRRAAALARIRARAVPIVLPDAAFDTDSLYED